MIYTLTFNPSLDYEMHVDGMRCGKMNRSSLEKYWVGGKGINVSTILHELEFDSIILGFVGGFVGEEIKRKTTQQGLKADWITLEEGTSRINVKVIGTHETEINGQGPFIGAFELQQLFEKLERLQKGDVLILSGSVPSCLDANIYQTIVEVQSAKGVLCVVDAEKDLLVNCLKFHPFLIKPNVLECESIFQKRLETTSQVIEAAQKLHEMGACHVLVSQGADGAVLVDEEGNVYVSKGIKGHCVSSIGAGDSTVAGFVAGHLKCHNSKEAFHLAMACGAATAFSSGLAKLDKIKECYEMEEIE